MSDARPQPAACLDRPRSIFGWAMYDFANTIYSAIVVTAYLPRFVKALVGREVYTGLAHTLSMVVAGLIVPVAGAWADRTGRAKRYLWWLTIACCVLTCAIGLVGNDARYDADAGRAAPTFVVVAVLLLYALANLTYEGSLVFYNTLLPEVASAGRQGRVSGLGVGLGYLGVVIALPIAYVVVEATGAMRSAFLVAGPLFFLSAIPLFALVRSRRPVRKVPFRAAVVGEQFRRLGQTLRDIARRRGVLLFFVGNFLVVDVVNTMIMWTRPYLEEGAGFTPKESIYALIAMSVSAFVLGMAMGWLTDRFGAKRTILAAAASILLCIVVAGTVRSKAVLMGVILLFGSGGLAGVWVAGRKFLLEVAPPGKVGAFFGLYGVTVKLSVLGCTLFAALADWVGYRPALASLLAPLIAGLICLSLSRPRRAEAAES